MNKKIKLTCLLVSIAVSSIAPGFAREGAIDWEETFNKVNILAFDARINSGMPEAPELKHLYATDLVELSLNSIKEVLTTTFDQRTNLILAYEVRDLMDYISECYTLSHFAYSPNTTNLSSLHALLRELAVETREIIYTQLEDACKPLIDTGDDYHSSAHQDGKDDMADRLIREQLGSKIERAVSLIDGILNNKKQRLYNP